MRANLTIIAFSLWACGNGTSSESLSGSDPCETTTATYETVGAPFLSTWCTPCHHSDLEGDERAGATVTVNLETYDLAIMHLDRIEARALGAAPTMPPAGGPSSDDLERFAFWLECGAIEHLSATD